MIDRPSAPRTELRALRIGFVAVAAIFLGRAGARAQLTSDAIPQERTIPAKEQIDADLQRSRLRLGPIRLLPSISLSNAGYDNNVFGSAENPVSDWFFTIRGGLRFLLPLGAKMYFRADALPQYTWYDKLADRRTFGGVANASLYGFFNRMTLQLSGSGSQDFHLYSTELQSQVLTKTVSGLASAEVEVSRPISVFASGQVQRVRYDPQGQLAAFDLTINNRIDEAARGGVRYRISRQWNVSAVYEATRSDFELAPETRDNESRAYLMGVQYAGPRFYANLSGGYRRGTPRDSSFPAYSTPTGSFFASLFVNRWLELQAYGHRTVTYSLTASNPYFFENQIGGGVNVQPLQRVLVRAYAQTGPNQYPESVVAGSRVVERRDERTLYGGGLSVIVSRPVVLTGLVTRSVTHSDISVNDLAVTRFTVGLSFSGEFSR